ncbi:Blue copper protein [Morus notabilis]|uniref:Blue copper protein n=2 Tax=Morus notabilis TaxID=981085 RepID=W9SB29_9ROSA|nr:Blue copper protein [Morus notabilis]
MGLMGCLLIITVALLKGATAESYVVGDSLGWTVPPNTSFYSDWTNSKTFHIGDEVLFNWTGTLDHNVAEVSTLAEYENCTKPGIVYLSGYTANLIANGSRFFLCTVDNHCELGMKMIVTVGSPTNTSSTLAAPPPSDSSYSAPSLTFAGALVSVFSLIVVSLFNYV